MRDCCMTTVWLAGLAKLVWISVADYVELQWFCNWSSDHKNGLSGYHKAFIWREVLNPLDLLKTIKGSLDQCAGSGMLQKAKFYF